MMDQYLLHAQLIGFFQSLLIKDVPTPPLNKAINKTSGEEVWLYELIMYKREECIYSLLACDKNIYVIDLFKIWS